MSDDRERLRTTFDSAAALYDEARPEYPSELFDALIALASLAPGASLLEVGCATGKATRPLARRGYRITCVELGESLAALARRNLAAYPSVTVITGNIESFVSPLGSFDLVFAATAWHWIDSGVRYAKAWELLRPGGHLAFWDAVHVVPPPPEGDPFFREIQDIYDEIGEGLPEGWTYTTAETLYDRSAEITASGLFTSVQVRRFGWRISYTADEYIRLLDTFSGHIAMAQWQRDRLYGEIRSRLASRPDGRVLRDWGGILHVARRVA